MSACNHCGQPAAAARLLFVKDGYRLVECAGCGLACIANPPSAAVLAEHYASDDNYHARLRDTASPEARRIARIASDHLAYVERQFRACRLLDVGCSTGEFLARAKARGFACAGIEYSAASAEFARSQSGLAVETGSIHDTALADASIDLVTMFDVIEHVPDPAADIARVHRLLRPGGHFLLATPNIDGLFPRLSHKVAGALDYWPHPEPPGHLYQFSPRTLGAMLTKAGFEPGAVSHRNIDLAYSFGAPATLLRMPKRLLYAAVFAPVALLGPLLGQGDWFYLTVRKPG